MIALFLCDGFGSISQSLSHEVIAPGAARRYARRRWQFDSRRIYVRPRTGPQSAHPLVAGQLQAASVPIAWAGTYRRTYRQTDGRIAVSLNALYDGGIITHS